MIECRRAGKQDGEENGVVLKLEKMDDDVKTAFIVSVQIKHWFIHSAEPRSLSAPNFTMAY